MSLQHQPVVALDIGGSSVKSALLSAGQPLAGEIRVQPLDSSASADHILEFLSLVIRFHLEQSATIQGIALGFPGPFDYAKGISLIEGVAKFDAIHGVNIGESLRRLLGKSELQLRFRNDAEAAIVGEAAYGAGRAYRRLLGITLGTGCGSAFIVDQQVVTTGAGVPPNGWLYPLLFCDQPADEIFSTRGLLARFQQYGLDATNVAAAVQAANANYPAAIESFRSFGDDLGAFLQPFVSDFRADGVLLLGGIARAYDLFAAQTRQRLSIPILRGNLNERAALLGAAALFWG
ncbi:MAG: ROK family protein [Anaerolineae bacterium]|nr:ROK family protein [Anaerolineae bacterium]